MQIPIPQHDFLLSKEQRELTGGERRVLAAIRNKRLLFVGSAYGAFLVVLVLGWIEGWLQAVEIYEEEADQLRSAAAYTVLFFFLLLTIYFVNYYFKSVHPFVRDLKLGYKDLLYFQPLPYKTPLFDAYYVKTPSAKNAMIRISKEMFDLIQPGSKACLVLSRYARFPFLLEIEGRRIEFTEKHARRDG